jgi:hypothetical protein
VGQPRPAAVAPPPAEPPPLDPPASEPPPSRPSFLHTVAEMDQLKPLRQKRQAPPPSAPNIGGSEPGRTVPPDFVLRSSPWVDFALVSFNLEDRAGNFLNLGVQFGGYLFERLRVAGRIVTPLDDVSDGYTTFSTPQSNGVQSFERVQSRSMSMLYSASVGLLITNSRTFAFGPSVELQRTDVAAYGSAVSLGLPFEWTTPKHLRVGFEFALGHAFGGSLKDVCRNLTSPVTSCGIRSTDRPSGTAVLVQFNMGYALGAL